jgi:hypothetical protein
MPEQPMGHEGVKVEYTFIERTAREFVQELLRTSPGHLDTPAGRNLLAALALIQNARENPNA